MQNNAQCAVEKATHPRRARLWQRLQLRAPAIFEKCLELVREAEKYEEQCRRVRNVVCRTTYHPQPELKTETESGKCECADEAAPVATALSDLQLWPSEDITALPMSIGEEFRVDATTQHDVEMDVPPPMPTLPPPPPPVAGHPSPFPMAGAYCWMPPAAPPTPIDEGMDVSPLGEILRRDEFLPMAFEMAEPPAELRDNTVPTFGFHCFSPEPCVTLPCVTPTAMGPLCDMTPLPNPTAVTSQPPPLQKLERKRIRRAVRTRRNSDGAASTASFQSTVIDASMDEMPRLSEWSFDTATDRSFGSGFGSPIVMETPQYSKPPPPVFNTPSPFPSLPSEDVEKSDNTVCTPVSHAPPSLRSDETSSPVDSLSASFCLGRVSISGRGDRAGRSRRRFSRH